MRNMTARTFVYSHTLHTIDHTKHHSANVERFLGRYNQGKVKIREGGL